MTFAVEQEKIDAFKALSKGEGFRVSYRNREGKQYITVRSTIGLTQQFWYDQFDRVGIDYPFMTSGGGKEYTFRINPDERYRKHIDDMRNRGIR